MTQDNNESVLSRWSRRKLENQQPPTDTDRSMPQAVPEETAEAPAAALEDQAESQPLLTDDDMPALESLTEDSDYSGFMSAGVSDKLRNLALRKLFMAPVFNIRDGLDEYDEDYTYFEKLGDIVTCDMKHEIEMEEQRLREAMDEEVEQAEAIEEVEDIDEAAGDDAEIIEEAEAETGSIDPEEPCPEPELDSTANKVDSNER
jgi:hypothetical protein